MRIVMEKYLVLVALCLITSLAIADDFYWDYGAGTQDFSEPANWDPDLPAGGWDFSILQKAWVDSGYVGSTSPVIGPGFPGSHTNFWPIIGSSFGDGELTIASGAEVSAKQTHMPWNTAEATLNVEDGGYLRFGGPGQVGTIQVGKAGTEGSTINLNVQGELVMDRLLGIQEGTTLNLNVSGNGLFRYGYIDTYDPGTFNITMDGAYSQIRVEYIENSNDDCNVNLIYYLDGGGGVGLNGNGIECIDGASTIGADLTTNTSIEVYFNGAAVPGTYTVLTAPVINDPNANMLAPSFTSAGWSYQKVTTAEGDQELQVTYLPTTTKTVVWNNNSTDQLWSTAGNWSDTLDSDDIAEISLAGTDAASVTTAGQEVAFANIGVTADGEMSIDGGALTTANLDLGYAAGMSGTCTLNSGSVDVLKAVTVGKNGAGELNIAGGSFSCYEMVVSNSDTSTGAVTVSGSSTLNIERLEIDALTSDNEDATFTLVGSSATVDVGGRIITRDNSTIRFELDGTNGAGSGIVAGREAYLDGIVFVTGDLKPGTYTLFTADAITDRTGGTLVYIEGAAAADYEIVQDGTVDKLNVTIPEPQDCAEVIELGLRLPGDIDGDCDVDLTDFAELASNWATCNIPNDVGCIENW